MDRRYCPRSHPLAATAAVLLWLAGCAAVGPDHVAPQTEAPARWSDWHGGDATLAAPAASPDAQQLARADWSAFDDPTLLRLQAMAADANQDIQAAALRFAQARVQQTMAAAQRDPQLAARAGISEQRQSEVGSGTRLIDAIAPAQNRDAIIGVLSDPYTLYQAGFDASWEPDLWGRVRRSVEAAQASSDAARASVRQIQWSIAAEIARAYFQLRNVQQQLDLAQADIAVSRDALALLRAKVGGGLLDDSAPVRQRQQLDGLEARLPQLRAQEAQAINQLTLLVGARPGALNEALAKPAAANDAASDRRWPDLALGVPSELAHRRPDIAAAEARLHAATAQIGIANADLYPRITLGASFGFESVGAQRFGEWGSRQWTIGPSLSLPIFDQGRRRSTIALRELEQQEAAVAYQQTVLRAWHEVDTAVSAYMAERQRQQRLARQVADSRDDLALAQAKYRHGMTDALPALDAQRALLQAQRDAADSAGQLQVALVAVYKALGDGGAASQPAHAALAESARAPRPAAR
ncbi:MAG TPA: efflux transporter outer membrane subunit [Burkholderiaceae bacterium]